MYFKPEDDETWNVNYHLLYFPALKQNKRENLFSTYSEDFCFSNND